MRKPRSLSRGVTRRSTPRAEVPPSSSGGQSFSDRLLAFEAATGMQHDIAWVLAAPFAILRAIRWYVVGRWRAWEERGPGAGDDRG